MCEVEGRVCECRAYMLPRLFGLLTAPDTGLPSRAADYQVVNDHRVVELDGRCCIVRVHYGRVVG